MKSCDCEAELAKLRAELFAEQKLRAFYQEQASAARKEPEEPKDLLR